MTTTILDPAHTKALAHRRLASAESARIPLTRLVRVELRKMLDTRSGFWLIASIGITAVLATVGVILFADGDELTYSTFATAIRFPVVIILPLIAILAVTSEWTQRTGLTTFTLVPLRQRVITAKAISSVIIAIAAMALTFAVGALGNLVGAAVKGRPPVWDVSATQCLYYVLGMVMSLLVGFMLGVLIRASTGALVAYFVYTFLVPTALGLLADNQQWFKDIQAWVDMQFAQSGLFIFQTSLTGQQWAQIVASALIWLVAPLLVGLRLAVRAEVK
jgi:ABC-2 type transport system permease protein